MEIDSNFSSLLQNLKLDDPWLPSKTWESISSESGVCHSENPSSKSCLEPHYDLTSLSEVNLVRLVINAMQGLESALTSIQKLSELLCTEPADRTSHRIPCLWQRSSSTNALGKILTSIGSSGIVALLLRKFVGYFLRENSNVSGSIEEENKIKQVDSQGAERNTNHESGTGKHHTYSLVNQSFAIAVEKVLEGYMCSLDTLYASVKLRRSPMTSDASNMLSSGAGSLTSVVHSEITLLEVYLHTKELRTRIEALGNICILKNLAFPTSSVQDLTSEAAVGFCNFPKGADLLTYLYDQLQDADPVHCSLLKYLFTCSCEPYCIFIKSWIYQARINDPFKEFIVEYVDDSVPYAHGMAGVFNGISFPLVKVRDRVSVPCFLEDFCLPLVRAGQQLQVLIKLLKLCHSFCPGDQINEDIIPYWDGSLSDHLSEWCPLTFNKCKIQEMLCMRESLYRIMQEKLQAFFARLDARYQQISGSVMPFGAVPIGVESIAYPVKNPVPFPLDENLSSPCAEIENSNLDVGTNESDASSAASEICEVDDSESSECSSLSTSAEQNESVIPSELHGSSIEAELRNLSGSRLLANLSNRNVLPNSLQSEKPHALACSFGNPDEGMDPISDLVQHYHKETDLSHISEHTHLGNATWSGSSETPYSYFQSVNIWPLMGLLKNPFHDDGGNVDETQFHHPNVKLKAADRNKDVLNERNSYFNEAFSSDSSLEKLHKGYPGLKQVENEAHATYNSSFSLSWNLKYNSNIFNMNPMLAKNTCFPLISNSSYKSRMGYEKASPSYFDFSFVEDPFKPCDEMVVGSCNHELDVAHPLLTDSAVGFVAESSGEKGHDGSDILVDRRNSTSASSSVTLFKNLQEENSSAKPSGGAKWESSLSYLGKSVIDNAGGQKKSSGTTFDMPIDVVIDKCILQEILLQYKYVSNFTIKLLEEGFDLQEHLLALRRYHFMEFADWADLFIISLCRHKWRIAEANQRVSEIQGFLDLALQRSSCDRDPYKERLFVYMKAPGMMPPPTSVAGVHAFDFIALGYKVEWPISMILTPSALKIYADIFSFLIQVRLAVFSVTDVWCLLKNLLHLIDQKDSEFAELDKSCCNILMKMRHQINHFVSTLQQYVQSQLSHVSWCKFLYSLKHQVKDLLDLELVHMAYLADSLHLCFLSDETKQVAAIIGQILQCALDFHSYFTGNCWEVGSNQRDSSKLLDRLNFSQVLTIKATFEKNLRELYLCYLKSPKHRDFSLCHFWGYLNYNGYYSNVVGDGINQYAF